MIAGREMLDLIVSEISGISPKAQLILGPGFVREEWKSLCFAESRAITEKAIQNVSLFAQSFVPESEDRVLDRSARIELIRQSFKLSHLKDALPTLATHRFRPKFYESIDRALQHGRALFSHLEEAAVLEARLTERLGREVRREEFFLLNRFWEKQLEFRNLFDEARILELAERKIREGEVKPLVPKIFHARHFIPSPREQFFWQSLGQMIEVCPISSHQLGSVRDHVEIAPTLAHSLEDAVHFLLDEILASKDLSKHVIVIEDRPEIRRVIRRQIDERGVVLLDPRDPTQLSTSEEVKAALWPLEIVVRNFASSVVLPWLNARFERAPDYRKQIIELGSISSIESYRHLPEVYGALESLRGLFPARMTLERLEGAIQSSIQAALLPKSVSLVFEKIFKSWRLSLAQLDLQEVKRPLRVLLDELRERLKSVTPIQAPSQNRFESLSVHFFGLTQSFFEPRENFSEWFSVRDSEVLSHEFGFQSREALEKQSQESFFSWAARSTQDARVWEYLYDEGGSETESIELSLQMIQNLVLKPRAFLPVHPSILPSLTSRQSPPIPFENITVTSVEFPMSFLNALGNCAFTAYAQHLLKLYDERDPDFDLSGDSFGNLVHSAVEAMVSSKLMLEPKRAFEEAWSKTAKPAWIRSERLKQSIRFKTISILEKFIDSERVYRELSRTECVGQEINIDLKRSGFVFHGRIDRVDQHADGLVVFDYKTGGSLPSGTMTRERGKGLQLPAYALALSDQHAQEVVGAQYIQLLPKKTMRNAGLLFARWNKGKKADEVEYPLSTVTARSSSLIFAEPEVVWKELDRKIESLIAQVRRGDFKPEPADPKDCDRCRYRAICGKTRGLGDRLLEQEEA